MNQEADSANAAPVGAALGPRPRVILVGLATFAWLRVLQQRAPAPRLDLRYLVEGLLFSLQDHAELRRSWIQASRQALLDQLVPPHGETDATASALLAGPPAAPIHRSAAVRRTIPGTGPGSRPAEGASARTPDNTRARARHTDCKALQIGEQAFRWLKGVQDSTVDPRLEMRSLIEGGTRLLRERTDLLPAVVERAREALVAHLTHLSEQTVPPISMEIQQ